MKKKGQENDGQENIELKIKANATLFFDMDGILIDANIANFLSYMSAEIAQVFEARHSSISSNRIEQIVKTFSKI